MAHFVLDVNQTLSDMAPVGRALEAHGAPSALDAAWFAAVLRDGFALSMHRHAPAFLDLARADLEQCLTGISGLDAPVDVIVDEALATLGELGVHDDVPPGLRRLHEDGHLLTAFSNGSERATHGLLERAGVREVVDHVLSVEHGSVWKPHPAAYAYAAETLGTATSELVMVAVHPWDLDGAARAGLRTAWVNRDGGPWPTPFRDPDERVGSLVELAELAGQVPPPA